MKRALDPKDWARVHEKARVLAADAKAWAAQHGVAGGDDAEAAMILLVASALIGVSAGASGTDRSALRDAYAVAREIHDAGRQ